MHYRQEAQGNKPATGSTWSHSVACPATGWKAREKCLDQLPDSLLLNTGPLHHCQRYTPPSTAFCLFKGLHKHLYHTIFASIQAELFSHCHYFSSCCWNTLPCFLSQPTQTWFCSTKTVTSHGLTPNITGERAGQRPLCQRNLEKPQTTEVDLWSRHPTELCSEEDCRSV